MTNLITSLSRGQITYQLILGFLLLSSTPSIRRALRPKNITRLLITNNFYITRVIRLIQLCQILYSLLRFRREPLITLRLIRNQYVNIIKYESIEVQSHETIEEGILVIRYNLHVATPEPGPTRKASPNRNPRDARLILFIFRVIKFSFSKVSRPESPTRPEWRIQTGARFTPTFSFILSKHFIMSFRYGSGFSFGQAHNHLQIQCNSVGP